MEKVNIGEWPAQADTSGRVRDTSPNGASEELRKAHVGAIAGGESAENVAFLAPDIVESIVEGRQPNSLTAEAVTRRIEMPLEWRSQRTGLNIQ